MQPVLIRFAQTNNTGAATLVNFVVPATSQLRRMFEGGGVPKFRLTSFYINVVNGGVTRGLPKPNLNLQFGYLSPDVSYHDADPNSPTFGEMVSDGNWYMYFNSDHSDWIEMPNGQIGSISALFVPPSTYTFAAGDDLYFFATIQVSQEQADPFKNFLKP